jgi:hypothetical protein
VTVTIAGSYEERSYDETLSSEGKKTGRSKKEAFKVRPSKAEKSSFYPQ